MIVLESDEHEEKIEELNRQLIARYKLSELVRSLGFACLALRDLHLIAYIQADKM